MFRSIWKVNYDDAPATVRSLDQRKQGGPVIIQGADLPLHVQLKNIIASQVHAGELRPGDPLPGERQLSAAHGLSRTTVRQALNELVADGMLYRRHGKGTFVAASKLEQNLTWLKGFAEELREQGIVPGVRVLQARLVAAPPDAASRLHLPGDSQVAFVQRLVSTGGEPLFMDRTYLTPHIGRMVLGADLAAESIYAIVERLGYPIRSGEQTIEALALAAADAQLLNVPSGAPALSIKRVTYIDSASPIEYAEALYRADRYQYATRLRRRRSPAEA